jgi:5-methylthioribose kinase
MGIDAPYRVLDAGTLPAYLAALEEVRPLLGGPPGAWQIREVGDGNLNLVFIVEGARRVGVRQAGSAVRARWLGLRWPMSPQRAYFEQAPTFRQRRSSCRER